MQSEKKKKNKMKFIVHRKTNNTNSDVTTSTKVLCQAARIAETITAGRPSVQRYYRRNSDAVSGVYPP